MKQILITYVSLSALGLSIAGCAADTTDMTNGSGMGQTTAGMTAEPSGAASVAGETQARQFLMAAMQADNSEIQAGQLAVQKGSSQAIKDYGQMMVREHSAHKVKVAQTGQALGVQSTNEPTPEGALLLSRLEGLSGTEFDRVFAQGMVASHRKTIAMYQQQEQADGPERVATLVRESLPILRAHLERAEALPQ